MRRATLALSILPLVALAVGGAGCGGGSDGSGSGAAVTGVKSALAMVRGIPQTGYGIGRATAKVRVEEFIDPQCPVCKKASGDIIPAAVKGPIRAGTAQLALSPLTFVGPDSATAAQAIGAAALQNKGFLYTEILYANQGTENTGWVTDDLLTKIAESIPGLDIARWRADRDAKTVSDALFAAQDRAQASGVQATPTFVVTSGGGTPAQWSGLEGGAARLIDAIAINNKVSTVGAIVKGP